MGVPTPARVQPAYLHVDAEEITALVFGPAIRVAPCAQGNGMPRPRAKTSIQAWGKMDIKEGRGHTWSRTC